MRPQEDFAPPLKAPSPATIYMLAIGVLLFIASAVWPERFTLTILPSQDVYEAAESSAPAPDGVVENHADFLRRPNAVPVALAVAGGVFLVVGGARWVHDRNRT